MTARICALILLSLAASSCDRNRAITVEFYTENGYRFSQAERTTIETIAEETVPEVRRFLPTLPNTLILKVYPGTDVIPETGEAASTASTDRVFWIVHPHRREGVIAIAKRELRGTLFHELHHLVRAQTEQSVTLMNRVVGEGLATAFERDAAGMSPPWGKYPDKVSDWVTELVSRGERRERYTSKEWMYRHPDGRRWIGMKVGTYIADRAIKASGKSAAELVNVPTNDVLLLADVRDLTSPGNDR